MIEELIFLVVPFAMAAVLALLLTALALTQYRVVSHIPADVRVLLLLVIVAAGALTTVAISPRVLNEKLLKPEFIYASDSAAGFMTSRVLSALVVGAALVEIVRGWFEAVRRRWEDAAWPVVLGVAAYYLGTLLFQAVGSEHPTFSPRSLYVPVVVLAACLLRLERLDRVMATAKWCIFACMAGSLVAALVRPDFALSSPYSGWLPGIKFRLFGLTSHANVLGPIALVGVLLELHAPSSPRGSRWLRLGAAFAVLMLAQSKTAWVAALAIVLLTWGPLNLLPATQSRQQTRAFGRAVFTLIVALLVAAAVAIAAALVDIVGFFERNPSLLTLTGRLDIWSITLDEWRKNIFFGYGPELWSMPYREAMNMLHVGQAHNQFVQTLGDSGLFGMAMLLLFLGALTYAGLRCFRATRGLILALVVLLLARCITEASLRTEGLLTWTTFTNVLLVVCACHALRQAERRPSGTQRDARMGTALRHGA